MKAYNKVTTHRSCITLNKESRDAFDGILVYFNFFQQFFSVSTIAYYGLCDFP